MGIHERGSKYVRIIRNAPGLPFYIRWEELLLPPMQPDALVDMNPCQIKIEVTNDGMADTEFFLYYMLGNFYQNHRRYVKSRSDLQLVSITAF